MKKLTIKQAIEQGYTHYGYSDREWQSVNKLHDDLFTELKGEYEPIDSLVLFEKEPRFPTANEDYIKEMVAEAISVDDSENCARDDDTIYHAVMEVDFSNIISKINEKLKEHKYWMLTDIKLIE